MNKKPSKQTYLPLSASMYPYGWEIRKGRRHGAEAYMKLWKQQDTLDGILDARAYAA